MKHRVYFEGLGELQFESDGADLLTDPERAKELVAQLVGSGSMASQIFWSTEKTGHSHYCQFMYSL